MKKNKAGFMPDSGRGSFRTVGLISIIILILAFFLPDMNLQAQADSSQTQAQIQEENSLDAPTPAQSESAIQAQTEDLYEKAREVGAQIRSSKVGKYGMTPIYAQDLNEGTWEIQAQSNSVYFKITEASITVTGGQISASFQISSLSYGYVYPGTKEQAKEAPSDAWIPARADEDEEVSRFTIPVPALDQKMECAAYSIARDQWYDRTLVFDASSLPEEALKIEIPDFDLIEAAIKAYPKTQAGGSPSDSDAGEQSRTAGTAGENTGDGGTASERDFAETQSGLRESVLPEEESETAAQAVAGAEMDREDGEYSIEVAMTGGSGRASISSPARLTVRGGRAFVTLIWSSSHYDYMIVDGVKYFNTNEGGSSTFEVPVTAFDTPVMVTADTDAMGEPVEIDYAITCYRESIGPVSDIPQVAARKVLYIGLTVIIAGGILNIIVKRFRRRRHSAGAADRHTGQARAN